ncbi:DnaJ homolog subfamily C member 19 [uncultured Gammaproteobacteria bacterium]
MVVAAATGGKGDKMMPVALAAAAALLVLWLLGRGFVSADVHKLMGYLRRFGMAAVALVLVVLVVTGRIGAALPLAMLAFSFFRGAWARQERLRAAQPASGRRSTLETASLRMTLDHDSGDMTGEVRVGPGAGRGLHQLPLTVLLDLLDYCRTNDPRSALVLESWLDRSWPDWRQADAARGGKSAGRAGETLMTREEALRVLDLVPGASPEQIKDAHRRLMMKLHPDHGGSNYLATKINQARDFLLGA